MNHIISPEQVYGWETALDRWVFYATTAFFLVELVRLAVRRMLGWNVVTDALTNFITFAAYTTISFVALTALYLVVYYTVYEYFSLTQIPVTPWSIALCVVLADLAYYFEHRFLHRVGIGWATHTVHHSSPHFNISVAYRFGPLDGFFPIFFHIPLVFVGFDPIVVFFSEAVVQLYQTILHTEAIRMLPKPVEAVMNTPSHHRVHHGSNPQYIDKNYGGIFIIWDRMFGTFAKEREPVVYGITKQLGTVNPFVVFFHGLSGLYREMASAKGLGAKLAPLVAPPG